MSSLSFSLKDADVPSAAVEIASRQVSAASIEHRGGQWVVRAHATEALPDGALVPSLTAPNVRDRAPIVAALGSVLERIGRPRRIGLVIPDPVVKVSLVRFEQVPSKVRDLDQLIRWQMRKSAPFPLEDAQIAYVAGLSGPEGQEFVVSCARREAVLEYEGLCREVNVHAGIVDLSTFNVANTVVASGRLAAADWLLVNVAPEWASIAILRGPHLILFRSRGADAEGTLADLAHQTAMYYEDRLSGAGFSQIMVSGSQADAEQAGRTDDFERALHERLGTAVTRVDPRTVATLTDRGEASPALLGALAPLVGMLVRGNEAAA